MDHINRVHKLIFFEIDFITNWFKGFNVVEIRLQTVTNLFTDMDKVWTHKVLIPFKGDGH